jgi:hypothetical protein
MEGKPFPTLPPDRPSRWALASRLIDEWFPKGTGPERPGFTMSEIVAAERRLGLTIPDALREWYLMFGALPGIWNIQDYLLAPAKLEMEGDRFVFVRENQNGVQWYIEAASLANANPDPPVMVYNSSEPEPRQFAASSISEFAIQMLFIHAKFSDQELYRANGQVTDEVIIAVQKYLPRMSFQDLNWIVFPTSFYGDDDIIVEITAFTWLWVTARSREVFDAVIEVAESAGMDWESLERPG